jgi:arginase family enzyme
MSRLRAKCPDCLTYTAVALNGEYQCHACGREFRAGLIRVPRAWGDGGEAMAESAALPLGYPETLVVEEDSLAEQNLSLASGLPKRPLILGGCCCAHVGAVEGLAARYGRLAVVWLDAHGDLNTPESSPSGNAWGMPLRMLIDGGAVEADDVALVGARNLDPPEAEFIAGAGVHREIAPALMGTDAVYLALDCDVLDPGEMSVWMPEPNGPSVADVEATLLALAAQANVVGAGFSGLAPDPANVPTLERFAVALGM